MNKFAHGSADNGFAIFALGLEAFAERADDRVMSPSGYGGHVQDLAQNRVAVFGNVGFACPLPRFAQGGRKAGKGHHLFGAGKALMRAQGDEQMGHRCRTDARYGFEQSAAFVKMGVVAPIRSLMA